MAPAGAGTLGSNVVRVLALGLSPEELIRTFGTIGLIGIIFAESGLLIGFFLPGDSLLFTAGLLASQGKLNLRSSSSAASSRRSSATRSATRSARRSGRALQATRLTLLQAGERQTGRGVLRAPRLEDDRARPLHADRADVRPGLAGVGSMRYRTFVTFNIVGGFLWAVGVTLLGTGSARPSPDIDKYLLPIIAGIVTLSLSPWLRVAAPPLARGLVSWRGPCSGGVKRQRETAQPTGWAGTAAAAGAEGVSVIEPVLALRERDGAEQDDQRDAGDQRSGRRRRPAG